MVQEHYVLKCVACQTFQSQIVKKAKKWECKICSTKQSLMKVYGQGSGKDCRIHTQKLNSLKGEKETEAIHQIEESVPSYRQPLVNDHVPANTEMLPRRTSKWDEYLDEPDVSTEEELSPRTEDDFNNEKVSGILPTKKRKISEVDGYESYNLDNDEFPRSNHCLNDVIAKKSVTEYYFKQKSVSKTSDLNAFEGISHGSTKIWNKNNLSNAESGLYLSVENNVEKSNHFMIKNTGNKLSCAAFVNQPINLNKSGDIHKVNSSSNNNADFQGEIYRTNPNEILNINYSAHDNMGKKADLENPKITKSGEFIFEQDCDLSDSEFQLDF